MISERTIERGRHEDMREPHGQLKQVSPEAPQFSPLPSRNETPRKAHSFSESAIMTNLKLISEAIETTNKELEQSNAKSEASLYANYLLALKHFGPERFEKLRCRKFDDVVKDLDSKLRLFRGLVVPAVTDAQGQVMEEAWARDVEKWAKQGSSCD